MSPILPSKVIRRGSKKMKTRNIGRNCTIWSGRSLCSLSGPPSLASCTRDVYAADAQWTSGVALRIFSRNAVRSSGVIS